MMSADEKPCPGRRAEAEANPGRTTADYHDLTCPDLPEWIGRWLSEARFRPYFVAAGSVAAAIELYWWNVAVSEAFYAPLNLLEVALRNALHGELRRRYAQADWWTSAELGDHSRLKMDQAIAKCRSRTGGLCCPDDVVAELSFGFWTSLLARPYDRKLWVPTLHRAFPYYRGPRRQLHDWLLSVVLFRNRIAHHEHVYTRDLTADLAKIRRLLGYLSAELVVQMDGVCRVTAVLSERPLAFGRG